MTDFFICKMEIKVAPTSQECCEGSMKSEKTKQTKKQRKTPRTKEKYTKQCLAYTKCSVNINYHIIIRKWNNKKENHEIYWKSFHAEVAGT